MTGAAGRDSGDGISGEDAGKEVFRRGLRERILEGGFQERDSGQRGCRQDIPEKKAEDNPPPFAFQAAFELQDFLELAALHEVEELLVGLR